MQPNSFEDWMNVSDDRHNDVKTLLKGKKTTGSIYMAGYAVEARLKAFLKKFNKGFPSSGSSGHNLENLWKSSGFRLSDIKDDDGARAFFFREWSTDLRYEVSYIHKFEPEVLVNAAGQLAGWIQTQIRRKSRKRGKK